MKSRLSVFQIVMIIVLFTAGCANVQAEDRRAEKDTLSVMSLNAQWMWDGIEPEESDIPFSDRKGDPEASLAYIGRIARIIERMRPDMVFLQEIEGENALDLLNNEFLSDYGYKVYFIEGTDKSTFQDVGLLSKIDPVDGKVHRSDMVGKSGDFEIGLAKHLYARFEINGKKIACVTAHLKSRPTDETRLHYRQAQADVLTHIATDLDDEGYEVIVLGDLNDFDGDECCLDINDHRPITNVLAKIKALDPADKSDDLVNVAQFVPKEARYTQHWDKNRNKKIDWPEELSSLDHALVSSELADMLIFADFCHCHDTIAGSDHYPVYMRFDTGTCKTGQAQ